MATDAARFTGNIPENYDAGLGPHIFVDYAADIARRAAAHAPRRVLETAAGTGIVTRRLRDALPIAEIVATDLNPGMLEIAGRKFRPGEAEFRPADATALPFAAGAFDLVLCQFGVMFYPDKDKSYCEALRVLKPGGRYLFNVWDSFAHNAFARIAHETISALVSNGPVAFYETPFGYSRIDPIKESLIAAGFADISAHVVKIEKRVADADLFARGIVFGNPVLEEIKARGTAPPEEVRDAVAAAFRREFGASGRTTLQAIVFEARRP